MEVLHQDKHAEPWARLIREAHNESKVAELLYETFSLFDLDGSGCMDSVEFEQALRMMTGNIDTNMIHDALRMMGGNMDTNMIYDVIREADMDQNGSIDFAEFTALANKVISAVKAHHAAEENRRKVELYQMRRMAAGMDPVVPVEDEVSSKREIARTLSNKSETSDGST
ncbi:hypothetical protein T484DRAFT_1784014, partial [Baffinella frigidus]